MPDSIPQGHCRIGDAPSVRLKNFSNHWKTFPADFHGRGPDGPGPTPVQVKLTSIRVEDLETEGAALKRVTLTIDNPDVQFMVKRTYDLVGTATTPPVWSLVGSPAHFTGGTATFDEPATRAYYRVGESE